MELVSAEDASISSLLCKLWPAMLRNLPFPLGVRNMRGGVLSEAYSVFREQYMSFMRRERRA